MMDWFALSKRKHEGFNLFRFYVLTITKFKNHYFHNDFSTFLFQLDLCRPPQGSLFKIRFFLLIPVLSTKSNCLRSLSNKFSQILFLFQMQVIGQLYCPRKLFQRCKINLHESSKLLPNKLVFGHLLGISCLKPQLLLASLKQTHKLGQIR